MLRIRYAESLVGVVLTLLVVTSAVAAPEMDAPQLLARLQSWLDETRDLQARFEQTLVSGAFGAGIEESGRIYLQRPGRMRWDYLDPEFKVALVEGDSTALYVAEDEQLWTGRLEEADALLPTLLAGVEPLERVFRATLVTTPKRQRGGYRLRLSPRNASETFEEVVLTLRSPRFALEEVEVLDVAGNRMRYRFSGILRNQGLAGEVFHFEPPPGTAIVAAGSTIAEP
jgi:outer membrane lipoprotein carrier protein